MKTKMIYLLLLTYTFYAQEKPIYIVDYNFKTNFKILAKSSTYASTLYIKDGESPLYQIKYGDGVLRDEKRANILNQNTSINIEGSDNFFYWSANGEALIYEDNIIFKEYVVEDSPEFQWDLTDETKTILGFLCYKATTSFRGREYIVYYTKEASVSGAPWKFNGLPGLVLEAYSIDGEFEINATSFRTAEEDFSISDPFLGKEAISWKAYKSLYTTEYDKALKSGDRYMPKMQFELLVD